MESYLAEIASDCNLSVSKFLSLVELIPEQSRVTDDGVYRAIDIYLKARPTISDLEKKEVCSLMDCQKLSREACAHATQNDHLSVQTLVQVLYYEQQCLQDVMNGSVSSGDSPAVISSRVNLYPSDIHPVSDELSSLKRENDDLKLELMKMKMRLKERKINVSKIGSAGGKGRTRPAKDRRHSIS
ncbi:BTB/POZ domain-containing protein [Hibiscus syriacus]|uniref:BTB/POZ domain-containing protein n=1 Tax=Hibiscus syriacus TaxID=106335 RepID=A0A6A3AHR7_HIBSY|nr:BTB/POZ domain-containing protein [Hibiscus syriacus]